MSEIYWVYGNPKDPRGAREALESKGVICPPYCHRQFSISSNVLCGVPGGEVGITNVRSRIYEMIKAAGVQLSPPPTEPEKIHPFDRIIGFEASAGSWALDLLAYVNDGEYMGLTGIWYKEIHRFEPWMSKYVLTSVPFKDWKNK